jgi:NADPH:quinone reductase-like Zn-dependent oxidoreductase
VEPPYVPGGAFAGHVLSVGAGVDPAWVGRRVAARTNAAGGGYAEQAVVAADTLIDVPEELGLPEATAVLTDGPTASLIFNLCGVGEGSLTSSFVVSRCPSGRLCVSRVRLCGRARFLRVLLLEGV